MWKVLDKLGQLAENILNALKFAAYDYDVVLRRTKTPRQRTIIWITIFSAVLTIIVLFLLSIKILVKNISEKRLLENERNGQIDSYEP